MYIEEEQTTQWPKDKGQKDLHNITHKTKDQGIRQCGIFVCFLFLFFI